MAHQRGNDLRGQVVLNLNTTEQQCPKSDVPARSPTFAPEYRLAHSAMSAEPQKNNPLHGLTLEMMLTRLVERFGWEDLAKAIPIKCFSNDPSIASSLKFLRKTPWARQKVEHFYLFALRKNLLD